MFRNPFSSTTIGGTNPIRTLGDYSKPSHKGYKNTIELPVGNNVVPLRSDTIRLVQNGCSFHGLRSEDPNQHLKDFLKLVDSLDLDGKNRERTRLCLFQFSLRDQASNWLERLLAGSITTWEDLTTRFLTQFFPPGRTVKLQNDILLFQQHHGESLSEAWTRFKDLLQKVSHHGIDLWLQVKFFMTMSILSQDEPLTNRPNDPRDFSKLVKAISLPQDVPSTSDRRLIELKNQVQGLMEAHLAPMQPTQKRLSCLRTQLGQQQDDMISKINLLWKAVSEKLDDAPLRDTAGNPAAQINFTNPSSPKHVHFVNSIVIINKEDEAKEEGNVKTSTTEYEDHKMTVESEEEFEEETKDEIEEEKEDSSKHFDTFLATKELGYHEWLLKNPRPPWVKAKIMSKRLGPRRKPSNPGKIFNFIGRVKGLKVFVGNFTYECDFMVLEDTTSVIDHDLGSVIFGKPFVEATGLVYIRKEGTITFEKDKEKIVFKMPHKMEMFKRIDFTDIRTNRIPPFAIESDDDKNKKTHYSDSLDLGPEYKHDENVCRAIRSLIGMKAKRNKGEVT
ncbi:MAK10-like protein [Tanacetum coccineum]|uniref:MAK10-like protein n=1 Tax=Tanacetum coccineum TaxID=301880 RepID=A0ABQ5DM68_9ASTR